MSAPDDRDIDDISTVEECAYCGWSPAAIILVDGDWQCYNCGHDPDETGELVTDGGTDKCSSVIDQIRRDAGCCPNCQDHGQEHLSADDSRLDHHIWICINDNCRIIRYKVHTGGEGA
jgi:ribosomal protein L37AE/L43A